MGGLHVLLHRYSDKHDDDGWDVCDLSPLRSGVRIDELPVISVRLPKRLTTFVGGRENLAARIEYVPSSRIVASEPIKVTCRVYLYALIPPGADEGEWAPVPHPEAAKEHFEIEANNPCMPGRPLPVLVGMPWAPGEQHESGSQGDFDFQHGAAGGKVAFGARGSMLVVPEGLGLRWPTQVWDWHRGELGTDLRQDLDEEPRMLPLGTGHEDVAPLSPSTVLVFGKVDDDGSGEDNQPDPSDAILRARRAEQQLPQEQQGGAAGEENRDQGQNAEDEAQPGETLEEVDETESVDDGKDEGEAENNDEGDWSDVDEGSDEGIEDGDSLASMDNDGNEHQILAVYEHAPKREGTVAVWSITAEETNQTGAVVLNYRKGTSQTYVPSFRLRTDEVGELAVVRVSEDRPGDLQHLAMYPTQKLLDRLRGQDTMQIGGTEGVLDWCAFGPTTVRCCVHGWRVFALVQTKPDEENQVNTRRPELALCMADYAPGASTADLPAEKQALPKGDGVRVSPAWDWSRGETPNPSPDGPDAEEPTEHPVMAPFPSRFRLAHPGAAVALDLDFQEDETLGYELWADDERLIIPIIKGRYESIRYVILNF